uniref:Uncharacterized protein n=1 Tax=Meloidogyne floridensis TaxID=298350 RepID=A0A915P169_9BILA
MKEDISSDSDYELIHSKGDLGQENEIEDKNVFEKPGNQINVEELKQTFQQMIDEIKTENSKQNSVLKEIIEQKNEKIICLENKVKQIIKRDNPPMYIVKKDLNELIEMFPLITKEGIKQILLASGGIKEIVSENLNDIFPKTN